MMYQMKNIITYDDEIPLPKCMYSMKNPNDILTPNEIDNINIRDQVTKFLKAPNKKMAELEQRQEDLLKKLDILYDRIKTISSFCTLKSPLDNKNKEIKKAILAPEEVVLVVSPDNLPYYLNIFLKQSSLNVNFSWHIHSSVPNEKVPKVKAFIKTLPAAGCNGLMINFRLIFKCVSADSELKLSSLAVPIVGNVNILRYLAHVYPHILPYEDDDYNMDSLLDIVYLLERTPEKNRETLTNKLFAQCKDWIYKNGFSVVDVAAYNVIKQGKNSAKLVPKSWLEKCSKLC